MRASREAERGLAREEKSTSVCGQIAKKDIQCTERERGGWGGEKGEESKKNVNM